MRLHCAYIGRDEARAFVQLHHRHHRPPQGAILHLGCWLGERLVGVAILGRPVSRVEQVGGAWELTRLCTDGTEHAPSCLLGYARRVVQLLAPGARLITYTLPEEGGASLRGAGWIPEATVSGGDWATRRRVSDQGRLFDAGALHPTTDKTRWRAP
jgi:hypothetical protein